MTATQQPQRSPAPGIIPGRVHVSHDAAPLSAATEKRDEPKGRRNAVGIATAKVMSALRGDKYMVHGSPTANRADPSASGDPGSGP